MTFNGNEMIFNRNVNPIGKAIASTAKDWTQVRAFSRSKMGNVDLKLEPKMGRISVKEVRKTEEDVEEIYILARDQTGMNNILRTLSQSVGGLQVCTADMRHIQIRLTSEKLRKDIEEFVNFAIETNKR